MMEMKQVWKDPDVFAVQVPFAHLGLDYTNCYFIRDGEDLLVIDPGVDSHVACRALSHMISDSGISREHVRFFCTHLHFDHVSHLKSMAWQGADILLSEVAYKNNAWHFHEQRKAQLRRVLHDEGVPRTAMFGLAAVMSEARVCDLAGCNYELLTEGQMVHVGSHALRVIETPGHSRGHICLFSDEQGFLISGDHVLEKITPGLALPFEGDDSMGDYLKSLAKLEVLNCHVVMPSHGEVFFDLVGRCAQLRKRHAMRLGQVYELVALNPGACGYEVLRHMPWKKGRPFVDLERMNPYQRISISSQTFAYLEYLVRIGELDRIEAGDGRHYVISD